MNKPLIATSAFSIMLAVVFVILCLVWFSWKLVVVIFIALWADNISNEIKRRRA